MVMLSQSAVRIAGWCSLADEQEASCNRKKRHNREFDARIESMRLADENPGSNFEVYECGLCMGYHVGST